MQNRGVFPYRRQGSRKRNRNGADRRPRAPQKGLPNNARDLLPMMQPATKALAQMLAGRAPRSGQLGHAQAIAAQADRLIAERAHNRLNPAEREEFFEQIARLKLTLADAQAEAEEQGVQEPVAKAEPRPLAQARLKEMALALAGPERARPGETSEAADAVQAATPPAPVQPDADVAEASGPDDGAEPVAEQAENGAASERPESAAETPAGRLQLSASAARAAADVLSDDERNVRASRRAQEARRRTGTTASGKEDRGEPVRDSDGEAQAERASEAVSGPDGGAASGEEHGQAADDRRERTASDRRAPKRHKQKGLPEGWVIDEEGYVVPGPG